MVLTTVLNLLLGVVLLVGRESLIIFGLLVSRTPWLFRFFDKVYLIVLGGVWLVAWIWIPGYLSRRVKGESMWRRFFKLAAFGMILLFATMILMAVRSSGGINWTLTLLSVVSLIGGAAILAWQKFNPSTETK